MAGSISKGGLTTYTLRTDAHALISIDQLTAKVSDITEKFLTLKYKVKNVSKDKRSKRRVGF